jgi:hypothetical protein
MGGATTIVDRLKNPRTRFDWTAVVLGPLVVSCLVGFGSGWSAAQTNQAVTDTKVVELTTRIERLDAEKANSAELLIRLDNLERRFDKQDSDDARQDSKLDRIYDVLLENNRRVSVMTVSPPRKKK